MPHSAEWEASLERLRRLAMMFSAADGVEKGRIFSGRGLRVEPGFFAFVAHDGALCAKVAAPDVERLVVSGVAEPLVMRGRELREWVRLPSDRSDVEWRDALRLAQGFFSGKSFLSDS